MLDNSSALNPTPDLMIEPSSKTLWNRGDVWRIFGLFFLSYIVVNIAVGVVVFLNDGEMTIGATVTNTVMMAITLMGSVLLVNRFRPKNSLADIGFKPTTRNWLIISTVMGALLVLRMFPMMALAEAYPALTAGLDTLMDMLVFDTMWETAVVAVLASFIVPIYEEFFFRGYVQNALAGRFGRWVGIIGSGVLFGAFHLLPLQALAAMPLGIIAAWLYDRTGSLWPAILLHIANNFVATAIFPLFM